MTTLKLWMYLLKSQKEIIFTGCIESLISHELRNIIGVIKENTGLIKDHLIISKDFDEKDKFLSILPKIEKQLKSGEKTILLLNQFSHLMSDDKKKSKLMNQ